jgi:hypothetical protein
MTNQVMTITALIFFKSLKVSETKYISLFISISKTHVQDITEILRQDKNYDNSKLKL